MVWIKKKMIEVNGCEEEERETVVPGTSVRGVSNQEERVRVTEHMLPGSKLDDSWL